MCKKAQMCECVHLILLMVILLSQLFCLKIFPSYMSNYIFYYVNVPVL
jgi:hypothetical protein